MNTESSFTPQHPQSQPGGPEPPAPAPEAAAAEPLKAERVQINVKAGPQRLKAERVQEELKAMPGWRLTGGRRALGRVRHFPDVTTAAAYAGHLAQTAAREGHPISVEVDGPRVAVTLRGKVYRGVRPGLTQEDLEFARLLG